MKFKAFITLVFLISTVFIMSGFMPRQQDRKAVNLKVLPKDISHEELDKVMDGFKVALGVKCNFCHAGAKNGAKGLDFASDEKPEKETARMMMKMTRKINKKFFHVKDADKVGSVLAVNCISCHNGKPHPESAQ